MSDAGVRLKETMLERLKHRLGQHNQKRHGWRGTGLDSARRAMRSGISADYEGKTTPEAERLAARKRFGMPEPKKISLQLPEKPAQPEKIKVKRVFDQFKKSNAPREIISVNKMGDEIWGYSDDAYTPDYMIQSQETRRWLRWAAELSDGRIVSMDGAIRITNPALWEQMQRTGETKRKSNVIYGMSPQAMFSAGLEANVSNALKTKQDAIDFVSETGRFSNIAKRGGAESAILLQMNADENPAHIFFHDNVVYSAVHATVYKQAFGSYPWEHTPRQYAMNLGKQPATQDWTVAIRRHGAAVQNSLIYGATGQLPVNINVKSVQDALFTIKSLIGRSGGGKGLMGVASRAAHDYYIQRKQELEDLLKTLEAQQPAA